MDWISSYFNHNYDIPTEKLHKFSDNDEKAVGMEGVKAMFSHDINGQPSPQMSMVSCAMSGYIYIYIKVPFFIGLYCQFLV